VDRPITLAGADIVLPDGVLSGASLTLEGGRITAVGPRESASTNVEVVDLTGCTILPGFVDVHMHGVGGVDTLDGDGSVAAIAASLPRYGVTSFCPTTVACGIEELTTCLAEVGRLTDGATADEHIDVRPDQARVLPAHLESNFINPDYAGAQPVGCLCTPRATTGTIKAADVLGVIARHRRAVGTITLAPELPGALELIRELQLAGHRVSLGHTGATFEVAMAAIEAGATLATHLFNRMPPMTHRSPGVAGAVLASRAVFAELICDGLHVHPAAVRIAIAAKGRDRVMAITDATSVSGLAPGAQGRLGGRTIRAGGSAAYLEDGTLAGSAATMDELFRFLLGRCGQSIVDAAHLCATTPAAALGLTDLGSIAVGSVADLTVLDRRHQVVRTMVAGRTTWMNSPKGSPV
jgi:N-acetylglucosamine-6-phosphate deacetylase